MSLRRLRCRSTLLASLDFITRLLWFFFFVIDNQRRWPISDCTMSCDQEHPCSDFVGDIVETMSASVGPSSSNPPQSSSGVNSKDLSRKESEIAFTSHAQGSTDNTEKPKKGKRSKKHGCNTHAESSELHEMQQT